MPDRRRDRAVDAGEPAVRVHRHLLAAEHVVGDAHQPRRPEHEPVVRPRGSPHGVDEAPRDRAARGWRRARRRSPRAARPARRTQSPSASGAGGSRSTDAARDACSHAPSHSRSGSPVATATVSTAVVTPLRFSGSPGPRSATTSTSASDRSAAVSRLSVGCPSTTTRSMRPPSSGSREQRAVAVHEVARRSARR